MTRHTITKLTIITLALASLSGCATASHDSASSSSHSHSVIIGSYPGSRCDSRSQAINDPEDCVPLKPLDGLKPLNQTPDITIAPCSMIHVPAYTRTDVCVAADGTIIPRH